MIFNTAKVLKPGQISLNTMVITHSEESMGSVNINGTISLDTPVTGEKIKSAGLEFTPG